MKRNLFVLLITMLNLFDDNCVAMDLVPKQFPQNPTALKTVCATLEQQSDLRFKLIHQLSTFEIKDPRSSIRFREEESFKLQLFRIAGAIAARKGIIDTTTDLINNLQDVADLFSSIYYFATTRASVFAMDGGEVKNTTLLSLIPNIWNALKAGPLADVDNFREYRTKLSGFIIGMGNLRTDAKTGTLTAENPRTEDVDNFLACLNVIFHPNDANALLRKKQRRYYQFYPNIQWGLVYILCAAYYGDDMGSFKGVNSNRVHESGEGAPTRFPPIIEREQSVKQESKVAITQKGVIITTKEEERMSTQKITLTRTVKDSVDHEVDIVYHKTVPLDLKFLQVIAFLGDQQILLRI